MSFLDYVDLLVDGRYESIERDLTLSFRGSRNQRVIDMKEAWKRGEAALQKISNQIMQKITCKSDLFYDIINARIKTALPKGYAC